MIKLSIKNCSMQCSHLGSLHQCTTSEKRCKKITALTMIETTFQIFSWFSISISTTPYVNMQVFLHFLIFSILHWSFVISFLFLSNSYSSIWCIKSLFTPTQMFCTEIWDKCAICLFIPKWKKIQVNKNNACSLSDSRWLIWKSRNVAVHKGISA